MKINIRTITNLKTKEAGDKMHKAAEKSLKDVIVAITNTVIKVHPWKNISGNNSRSIKFEIDRLSALVFSTSGYGGFLETGTSKMPARPYFKPALDKHIGELPRGIKANLK